MKLTNLIAGGLFAIITGVMSAPESARAAHVTSGAAMTAKAKSAALMVESPHEGYRSRIQCVRAPCYVPRPQRPWRVRHYSRPYWFDPHYNGAHVVCGIRYGHHGPRRVCHFFPD